MKLSIVRVAKSTFTVRGVEMSVSTVRIREGNTYQWLTTIGCKGSASDPFTSTDKGAALYAHDSIVDHVHSNGTDLTSQYADFVRSALIDLTELHTVRRDAIAPPSSGRALSMVPAAKLPTRTDVAPASNVQWIFAAVRDGRDGATIPAPGAA